MTITSIQDLLEAYNLIKSAMATFSACEDPNAEFRSAFKRLDLAKELILKALDQEASETENDGEAS